MIQPSLGNVVFIGVTATVFMLGSLAAVNMLAKKQVPVASPVSRGVVTFITTATTQKAA